MTNEAELFKETKLVAADIAVIAGYFAIVFAVGIWVREMRFSDLCVPRHAHFLTSDL